MKTLAQLLVEYCEKNDYDVSIESMREVILECLPQKWQGNAQEYRWRVEESRIFEIMDGSTPRYFMHNICTYSGENSWEDAGFTWQSFDEMEEVEPREVRTTKMQHTLNMALSECFKQATIYGDKTAIGMLCKMLEANTPAKLRQSWNEAYVVVERLVDSIIVQDIEDCIRGDN